MNIKKVVLLVGDQKPFITTSKESLANFMSIVLHYNISINSSYVCGIIGVRGSTFLATIEVPYEHFEAFQEDCRLHKIPLKFNPDIQLGMDCYPSVKWIDSLGRYQTSVPGGINLD